MPTNREARLIVGYDYDEASEKQVVAGVERLEKRFGKSQQAAAGLRQEMTRDAEVARLLQAEFGKIGQTDAIGNVTRQFFEARRQGVDLDTALQKVIADLDRIGASDRQVQQVARSLRDAAAAAEDYANTPTPSMDELGGDIPGSSGGQLSGRRRLGRLGSQIRGLPSMQIAGSLTSDAIGNLLRVSGSEFAGIAAGIGGMSIALALLANEVEKTSKAIIEEAHARQQVRDAIASQTREQALQARAEEIQAKARAEDEIERLRRDQERDLTNSLAALPTAGTGLGVITTAAGQVNAYNNLIAEQEAIIRNASTAIDEYSAQIDGGATAIQDAITAQQQLIDSIEELTEEQEEAAREAERLAEAEARLSQQRKEAERDRQTEENIRSADELAEMYVKEAQLRSGTAQQAQDYYDALLVQNSGLRVARDALIASGDKSEEAARKVDEYNRQIQATNDFLSKLLLDIIPGLAVAEEAAAQMQLLIDAGHSAAEAERELVEARRDVRLEQERHIGAVAQIMERENAALQKAEQERARAIENAERQSQQRLEEAQNKAREDREKADEEHYQKLRDIQRRFQLDFQTAVGERDALAAYNAQQQYKEARRQENQAYEQRKRDIDKALHDTTRDIQRALDEQHRVIAQRYNDQLQTAADAATAALRLENEKYTQELAIRTAAYNAALAQAQAFAETLISIGASLGRNIVVPDTETVAPEDLIEQGYLQPDAQIPSFDRGTSFVPHDMLAYVHRGERITPAAQNTNNTSNANIIIQMDGRSFRAASRREAARYVGELLGGQGIE